MKARIAVLISIVLSSSSYLAQNKQPETPKVGPYDDLCHVYVIDVSAARKAFDTFKPSGNDSADEKALSAGVLVFPPFLTHFEEEELTTKHYKFPIGNQFLTASVYYTDESMGSFSTSDKYDLIDQSMYLGIVLAPKELDSALAEKVKNASITEVTYDDFTNKVRTKQYASVNGKLFAFGLECNCSLKRESELLKNRKNKKT